jgi:hypothetical protein
MLKDLSRARGVGTWCAAALFALSWSALRAQDRPQYRDFQLGSNLPSISALVGVAASEAKTIHQRPSVMQELQWQRPYSSSTSTLAGTDPVKQITFSFYNDQLSRMIVDYDRDRTIGMTDSDLIEAISTAYGPPLKIVARTGRTVSHIEEESGTPVARWGDAGYSVVLYRSSYASGFRMIVASPRLEALARTAEVQALRLDELEAPRRELERQKKEAADTRISQEKARVVNKAAFRP